MNNPIFLEDIFIRKGPQSKDDQPTLDWSSCNDFYVIDSINDNAIELKSMNTTNQDQDTMHYQDVNAVLNDFFGLSEMLSQGEFIGRQFKRNRETADGDYSYTTDSNLIALYRYQNVILAINGGLYSVIPTRYVKDNNIFFYGVGHDEYRDTHKVFQEVKSQINELNEKNKRTTL